MSSVLGSHLAVKLFDRMVSHWGNWYKIKHSGRIGTLCCGLPEQGDPPGGWIKVHMCDSVSDRRATVPTLTHMLMFRGAGTAVST